jgi:hypothetical protein
VSTQVARQPKVRAAASPPKPKVAGFGHAPAQEAHHFVVSVPKAASADVMIYEVFQEDDVGPQLDSASLRCVLNRARWLKIVDALEEELNRRLREVGLKTGKFKAGETPVARLLGKELVLLAWAIEDADPTLAHAAIQNWRGLSPEERWWLYTMTAAQTGHYSKRNVGWRKAVRYALTENPVVAVTTVTTAEHKRRVKAVEKVANQGKLFDLDEEAVPYAASAGNGIWGEPCQQPPERESDTLLLSKPRVSPETSPQASPSAPAKTVKASSRSSSPSPSSPRSATRKGKRTPARH